MPWLRWLFETCSAPPSGGRPCAPWLCWIFHGSNLVISLCYLAIPAMVLWYWRYRRDGISPLKLWMVIAFLPIQALSRLARVDGYGGFPFHLYTALDLLAALVTLNSLIWLRPKILHILMLPSRRQMHDLNDRLHVEVLEKEILRLEAVERNRRLLAEVERARHALGTQVWIADKQAALDRLAAIIKEAG